MNEIDFIENCFKQDTNNIESYLNKEINDTNIDIIKNVSSIPYWYYKFDCKYSYEHIKTIIIAIEKFLNKYGIEIEDYNSLDHGHSIREFIKINIKDVIL